MSVNDPDYTVSIFAILVGIDTYSPPFSPLNKAVGDVNKVKRLLLDHRQIELKDITVLTNEKATRENIIEALSSLPRGLPRDTSVLFYFSGYSGSANESGVLCPVDSFEPGVGTISDKTLIRLFESMSLSLNGNIVSDLTRGRQKLTLIGVQIQTVFLDCFSEGFRWENPSSFVVISPEKATETVDGGAFTKSLVDVLKREKHLDGLTNESLVDKIRAAMYDSQYHLSLLLSYSRTLLRGATIYCHGQQANHVIFNPRLELCHLFIRGRTEPGKIVIDAGYAQGIRTGSIFGVYTSSIQRDWNIVLGHLVVEVIHDTYTIVRFQGNRPFELPSVFFVVELDSELDTINAYILDGAENEHKSIQSIPGLKIVDSVKDAEIALKFGLENEQDVFCCTWNGIKGDKEYQRITTTRPILSAPNSVYSPIWLPLEDLRDHVRNLARFKYHMGRKIPNTGFSTVNLDWKLYEYGEAFDNLRDNFIHIQLKEGERRGPFYITLRNPNRFQVWPHVFIGVGDHHVISMSSA